MIITIDGPAGTGKSSVAKEVAKKLSMLMLDTGALYRAIAYGVLQKNIDEHDEDKIAAFLKNDPLTVIFHEGSFLYFIDTTDVTLFLRTQEVANTASIISSYASVRSYLLTTQRTLAKNQNIVCEGRDMGSTVFPEAEIKIYLTASAKERSKRRFLELTAQGTSTPSIESIEKEIEERDQRDSTRKNSPLRIPQNAHIIDTTQLTLTQVVAAILQLVTKEHPTHQNH